MKKFKFLQKENQSKMDELFGRPIRDANDENRLYLMDFIQRFKNWSIPGDEDSEILYAENNQYNVGVVFNGCYIDNADDDFTIAMYGDLEGVDNYEGLQMNLNTFKDIFGEITNTDNHIENREVDINGYSIEYMDDYIVIHRGNTSHIGIPFVCIPSIKYVWEQILDLDIHEHFNTDSGRYDPDEEI
jgi:hypothetical protein